MRIYHPAMWGVACLLTAGCAVGPPIDQALPITQSVNEVDYENPVLIAPGNTDPITYNEIFSRVLSVVSDYFELSYQNRYDGWIVTQPRICPGYEQPWKAGSPNMHERLLATLQTMRNRCQIRIRAAQGGGYLVQVIVYKELKDDPVPALPHAGAVSLQEGPSVDRQYEVVDQNMQAALGERWIPKGRDYALERAILLKIQKAQ